jgi:hypothetical protein
MIQATPLAPGGGGRGGQDRVHVLELVRPENQQPKADTAYHSGHEYCNFSFHFFGFDFLPIFLRELPALPAALAFALLAR